ncbi:Phage terminase-like protein, large subunit [Weissella viridescens]|uniref:Phage terminase-like protein, large subunit n=1 Tax=Weissella viridescens TaxID=1629 RepID=A0A380P867_WEIVI|nr:Phage terminase-like protein, large subunit [Weissella viridescens]
MKKIDLTKSKDVSGSFFTFDSSAIKQKYTDEATQYAFRVLEGKQTAGYQLQLACLRHVRDLMRVEECDPEFSYVYSSEKVTSILTFAALCPDPDAGKPLPLMPWQKFILCQLIGWRTSGRDDKRFTLASVSVARKQGKTYFAAIILAYSFLLESIGMHNQDFLAAANTSDQTAKLYGYVSDMIGLLIEKQPLYREYAKRTGVIVQEKQIIAKKVRNRLVKVSNESGKYDGYHFTTAVYDEAGDEKAGKYTSRITTGQQDVRYHQFIKISTAYEFLGTEFHNGLKRGQEVMEQDWNREYDYELWLVWAQDDENEVYQPETWEKSTPLIGMPSRHDSTIDSLMKLRENMITQGKLAEFQNKSMNIYLQDSNRAYLRLSDVDRAIVPEFEIDRRKVYIGFDYSMMSDNTAIAFVYPYMEEGQPKWHIEQHSFIPWEKRGQLKLRKSKMVLCIVN